MKYRVCCQWRKVGCALTLAAFLFGQGLLSGQASPEGDVLSLSLEELTRVNVYTASRHLQHAREAPSAVTVITADDIRRYGWRTLADMLRTLRGFYSALPRSWASPILRPESLPHWPAGPD